MTPATSTSIVAARGECVGNDTAARPCSDYQEYLGDYGLDLAALRRARFDPARGTIVGEREAAVHWSRLAWDTDVLGIATGRINAVSHGRDANALRRVVQTVVAEADTVSIELLCARVGGADPIALRTLEDVGFEVADTMRIMLWQTARPTPRVTPPADVRVAPLEALDAATRTKLRELAADTFRTARIACDPRITAVQARAFYGKLFESSLDTPGAVLRVAFDDLQPIGFVLGGVDAELAKMGVSLAVLQLIAVDAAAAGRGVGRALLAAFTEAMHSRVDLIEVGTQCNNAAALNLYQGFGYEPAATLTTLHRWRPGA